MLHGSLGRACSSRMGNAAPSWVKMTIHAANAAAMTTPAPTPSTHIPEMVIATVAGVAFGVKTGHYLAGIFIGIVLGVALSVLGTVVRARSRR